MATASKRIGFKMQPKRFAHFRQSLFWIPLAASIIFSLFFLRGMHVAWLQKNPYLQGMVFSLTVATMVHACFSIGIGNALMLFGISFIVSYAAESTGIRWSWPFGSGYHYNPCMVPRLPGEVPLCIPLIWFSLIYTAVVFLRPIPIRRKGILSLRRVFVKAALCGLVITALDFVIDPLGVLFEGWSWHEPGGFFNVPIRNFGGWFLVGLTICSVYIPLEKYSARDGFQGKVMQDLPFVAVSVALTVFCFVGCAVWVGSILPPVLSLAVMGPCWLHWAVSARKVRREWPGSTKQRIENVPRNGRPLPDE
jgi:uncharacterized membrane protein